MDTLTHIFLPLTILYLLKRELSPAYLPLAFFAILPDFDKIIGIPGLFHSLLTLLPLIFFVLLIEKYLWNGFRISLLISFFLFSHLLLDLLDGGPVAFLYPISKLGIGFEFPMKLVVKSELSIADAPVRIVYSEPRMSDSYEILSGFGIVSAILFAIVYLKGR